MVQPAADWKRNQVDRSLNYLLTFRALGGVSAQSLMGPSAMVILLNVFGQQTIQVAFTEYDDVIEQLSAKRADKPFHIRILPGASVSCSHFFNAAAIQELPDSVAIDAVIVTEQVSGLATERCGFPKLLNDPLHGRMIRRREMNHFSAAMVEDDEHVEKRKVDGDYREEVHRPGDVQVVVQEGKPVRRFVRLLGTEHVLTNGVAARRIAAEKSQSIPDSLGTP